MRQNMDYDQLFTKISQDGYCTIPGFFPREEIREARQELSSFLDEDVEYRRKSNVQVADHIRDGHHFSLTPHMHTMLFPAFQSKRGASLIEKIITDETIAKLLTNLIGENYRLRVDLVRRASGMDDSVDEFQVPHEWHRDTPGEFTFGIFLDDMGEPFSGGTAVIEGGTHFQPYDPIWDFMFGKKSYTTKAHYYENKVVWLEESCRKLEVFNKLAKWRLIDRTVEIKGNTGDIYFFLNDAWHGRAPNKRGGKFMTIRFGGFPTDFPFKDDLPLPAGAENLPPALRKRYSADQRKNSGNGLLIHTTRKSKPDLVLALAHWEKMRAVRCTESKAAKQASK